MCRLNGRNPTALRPLSITRGHDRDNNCWSFRGSNFTPRAGPHCVPYGMNFSSGVRGSSIRISRTRRDRSFIRLAVPIGVSAWGIVHHMQKAPMKWIYNTKPHIIPICESCAIHTTADALVDEQC